MRQARGVHLRWPPSCMGPNLRWVALCIGRSLSRSGLNPRGVVNTLSRPSAFEFRVKGVGFRV